MVSAWACGSGLVLGQMAVDDKSNESTAIPALLRLLDLRGATATSDALGCQTAIAARIASQGVYDALALQDQHPTLRAEVAPVFAAARATAFVDDAPIDHNHIVQLRSDTLMHVKPHSRLDMHKPSYHGAGQGRPT